MKSKIVFNIYILTSMLNIIAAFMHVEALNMFTKPLLMPILLYLLYVEAEGVITLPRLLLSLALIFSWLGDVALMYVQNGEIYFLAGLGSFLVAHVVYLIIFTKTVYSRITFRLKAVWPIFTYGFILLLILAFYSGNMTIPVITYGLCILAMATAAILRKGLTQDDSYRLVLTGAILFVISDSVLAINKFVFDIPLAQVSIMLTYISAQYYIMKGVLAHPG